MLPRRRAASLLLLPILAFVFMVGWIMYIVGERQSPKKAARDVKNAPKNARADETDLEIGLMTELAEEQTVTE